jgi:hypothetical protein
MPNIPFQDGSQPFVNLFLKNRSPSFTARNNQNNDDGDLRIMGNHLVNFEFTELHGSTARFNLTLYDATFDAFENALFTGGFVETSNKKDRTSDPTLTVKWGWNTFNAPSIEAPVWDMHISEYKSRFVYGQGVTIEMAGWANPGLLTTRGHLTAGPADVRRISDKSTSKKFNTLANLVEEIAKQNGMSFDVEDADIIKNVSQNGKNDLLWLKQLVRYAIKPKSGNRLYKVWVRNTTRGNQELVVRTNAATADTKTWDYLFGVDRDGQVLEYETNINSMVLFGLGGGGFKSVVMDPKTKDFCNIYVDESTMTGTAGEGKFIPQGSVTKAPLRMGFQDEESARIYAEDKYLALNTTNVTATLVVHGNPLIGVTDIVNVIVLRKGTQINDITDLHPSSGAWSITQIKHLITNGSYRTELELHRRGNITRGSGGNTETTGTEAATNQVQRANSFAANLNKKEATKRKNSKKEGS